MSDEDRLSLEQLVDLFVERSVPPAVIDQIVPECWSCPFAVKRDWSNEDGDSGIDIEDCALGVQGDRFKAIREMGDREPPSWCALRKGPVLVRLGRTS